MKRPRRSHYPTVRTGPDGAASAVMLVVACVAVFAAVYTVTVRTTPGRQFGDASLRGSMLTRSDVAAGVNAVLGVVSLASLLAGIAVIAMGALARLQRVSGAAAIGLVLAANVSTWVLKNHLLTRPDLGLSEVTPATHNSLPSGHTTAVFSVVVAVLFVAPPPWRKSIALAGGSGSILMALATLSAGWHRAGDSIAAFALVGALAGLAALVIIAVDDTKPHAGRRSDRRDRPAQRRQVATIAGAGGVAICLSAGLVLVPALRASTVGAATAFLIGTLLIITAAIAVLIGVQAVLARARL